MIIRRLVIPLIAVAFLLGSVPVGQALGVWQTTGRAITTLPAATTEDIKGSSTLSQVSKTFAIPQDDLYKLLGLPADISPQTKLKELKSYNEVSAVRAKVAEYKAGHP